MMGPEKGLIRVPMDLDIRWEGLKMGFSMQGVIIEGQSRLIVDDDEHLHSPIGYILQD
jgi:hypothetical protein